MNDPARILLDVGIESVAPERAVELANVLTRWVAHYEEELVQRLAEHGFDAVVNSQAGDYER